MYSDVETVLIRLNEVWAGYTNWWLYFMGSSSLRLDWLEFESETADFTAVLMVIGSTAKSVVRLELLLHNFDVKTDKCWLIVWPKAENCWPEQRKIHISTLKKQNFDLKKKQKIANKVALLIANYEFWPKNWKMLT